MSVKYWGVRGSLPSSASPEQWVKEFESFMQGFFKAGYTRADQIRDYVSEKAIPQIGGFGTATTCVQVRSSKSGLILDAGSGIRNLGEHLMSGPVGKGAATIHIFLTHFHWDHILGLPFFTPLFVRSSRVHFYAVQPEMEDMVRGVFKKPYFPVSFEALQSEITFHRLEPRKTIEIDDMRVTPYQLDHPDPCWGFRVESGGRVYSHCVDTEGTRSTREALGPDLPMYQNVDLMYFDAQYTLPELAEKANWGHSASQIGLDIAFRERIKYVIFAHHDPGATSKEIFEIKRQTQEYFDWRVKNAAAKGETLPKIRWCFAHEGLEIDLSQI